MLIGRQDILAIMLRRLDDNDDDDDDTNPPQPIPKRKVLIVSILKENHGGL